MTAQTDASAGRTGGPADPTDVSSRADAPDATDALGTAGTLGTTDVSGPADAVDLEELGRAVKEAQYRHHRALDTRLAAAGTTLAQWDALRAIARAPGASAHELAVATFQGDQSFGTLASRLAAQGLVERRPGRGRRIEHRLTADGERVLTAGRTIRLDVLTASFAPLDQDERATLLALLRRVGLRGEGS